MLRAALWIALVGLVIFYHYFFGAGPTASQMFSDLEWWRPKGWALRWLPAKALADMARQGFPAAALPIAVFTAPLLVLLAIGFGLFRNALARAGLFSLVLVMCVFVFYGYTAESVWRFFEWRFPAVVLVFSGIVAGAVFAPSLAHSALRRGALAFIAIAVLTFATIFVLMTEITGTNPAIAFNVSPWPIVSLFGLLLVGYWLSALHASAGAGVWLGKRLGGGAGFAAGAVCSAIAAFVLAFPIFQLSAARIGVGLAALAYAGAVAWLGPSDRNEASRAGLLRMAVGLFVFVAISLSNSAASSFQVQARDTTALRLLVALEEFKAAEQTYPDDIAELVPEFLDGVPRPRIGLLADDDGFTYTSFGDSYALEFASVLWVQCQYSPPFEYDADDLDEAEGPSENPEEAETWELDEPDVASGAVPNADDLAAQALLAEHELNGSWSCSKTPPTLW
ncbi:MAG: hypothetical protein GY725_05130 [bacterium]|nr:hypothetical protein [bacterium]